MGVEATPMDVKELVVENALQFDNADSFSLLLPGHGPFLATQSCEQVTPCTGLLDVPHGALSPLEYGQQAGVLSTV